MGMPDGRRHVFDEVERLREDEAVERLGRHGAGVLKIRDDGRFPILRIDVEHVAVQDVRSEPSGVVAIPHLEDAAMDARSLLVEELLDEVAIDRLAAVSAEDVAQGLGSPDGSEPRRAREPT
jgi:hypothetical protein